MTEVLSVSPDGSFSSLPTRRKTPQPSLFLNTQAYGCSNVAPVSYFTVRDQGTYRTGRSSSISSSAPPSPRQPGHDLSSEPSYASTPTSSISTQDGYFTKQDEDDLLFPSWEAGSIGRGRHTALTEADSRRDTGFAVSHSGSNDDSGPLSIEHNPFRSAGDDTAVESQPSRHVDYLSHNWKEEDIWASWRHITGKRKILDNWQRLENASWRTWAKSMNKLDTVSPEALNWLV